MNDLKFKYLSGQNILPFGPEGFELDLTALGGVVMIEGDNRDRRKAIMESDPDAQAESCRNGVGKSSIPDVLVYALFGKTVKRPEKLGQEEVVNNKTGKKLRAEVRFDTFKVVRCRKPNSLRLWEHPEGRFAADNDAAFNDKYEKTLGTMSATQAEIERIVGLSYEAFVNIVVFTDNNAGSFLECDGPTKREIVENLLSLQVYREYAEKAKLSRNKQKELVGRLANDYDHALAEVGRADKREEQVAAQDVAWRQKVTSEVAEFDRQAAVLSKAISDMPAGSDMRAYEDARAESARLSTEVDQAEANLGRIDELLKPTTEKLAALNEEGRRLRMSYDEQTAAAVELRRKLDAAEAVGRKFTSLSEKADCPTCLGEVKPENFSSVVESSRLEGEQLLSQVKTARSRIQEIEANQKTLLEENNKLLAKLTAAQAKAKELRLRADQSRRRINELSLVKPPMDVGEKVRLASLKLDQVKALAADKRAEFDRGGPYAEIAAAAKFEAVARRAEADKKKTELNAAEAELPYHEFYVRAFGDNGIRKFVIDGIIPTLNNRVAHWMQPLIGGTLKLAFDNKLDETVESVPPDGSPFAYFALSGGERRRVNLAVSAAFSYMTMLNWGTSPSVLFLDEVTTNIDPQGVRGVCEMIRELARTRQVFVTTHDEGLRSMLEGCRKVSLVHEGGFTRLDGTP